MPIQQRHEKRAANVLSQLILSNKVIEKKLFLLRTRAGIPLNGFKVKFEFDTYFERLRKKNNLGKFLNAEIRFKNFIEQQLTKAGMISVYSGLHAPLREYFVYNNLSKESSKKSDVTGCSFERLENNDSTQKRNSLLPGLYIRFGFNTSAGDVATFVRERKEVLESHQDAIRLRQGVPSKKRLNKRSSKLNELVEKYDKLSTRELQEISGSTSGYRDILISGAIYVEHQIKYQPESINTSRKRLRKRGGTFSVHV